MKQNSLFNALKERAMKTFYRESIQNEYVL